MSIGPDLVIMAWSQALFAVMLISVLVAVAYLWLLFSEKKG